MNHPRAWHHVYTVMMRNLPNKVSKDALIAEIDECGFSQTYDFMYLPIDANTGTNRGYSFINFHSPGLALMFKDRFDGHKFRNCGSHKVVSVVPARLQGFEANYASYAKAPVKSLAAQPFLLR